MHLGQLDKSSASDFSQSFNIKLKSRQSSTALGLLAALGLSACGGGGSQTTSTNTSNGTTNNSSSGTTTPAVDDGTTDDTTLGGVGGGFGGGGGGGGGGAATAANSLTLTRSGLRLFDLDAGGFYLLGTDSYYQVADAANDAYTVTLTASGGGMLTFEFADADDVVTLESGSTVSGFSQMRVIRGTVDVSDADIGGVTYVSVASSVKLTAAQVLDLDAIVIDAASGGVEVSWKLRLKLIKFPTPWRMVLLIFLAR